MLFSVVVWKSEKIEEKKVWENLYKKEWECVYVIVDWAFNLQVHPLLCVKAEKFLKIAMTKKQLIYEMIN